MMRPPPPLAIVPMTMMVLAGTTAPASVLADDHGDAPQSYGVASHGVTDQPSPWLGLRPPDEEEPRSGPESDGDDLDGDDDEDGVFAFPDLVQNGKSWTANVFASNPTDRDVMLVGWVDVDGNGRFDADEYAVATVPAGADNTKIKLVWPNLSGVATDFTGPTHARFRISSDPIGSDDATGRASDGEVEDYTVTVQLDADGDERPDATDPDDDNDGIPDEVEGGDSGRDTDGDGLPDSLDTDSDADGIPDFIEAGELPSQPADTDGDGVPDYLDRDSDNDGRFDDIDGDDDRDRDGVPDALEGDGDVDSDGIANADDLDSDNDSIPDAIERGDEPGVLRDTDGDRVPDLFDLDSDDDGIPDLYESNSGEVDVGRLDNDRDGRLDTVHLYSSNGFADALETDIDSGVPLYAVPDSDGDGVRDFRDRDSDGDGVSDLVEAGRPDRDDDGQADERIDSDGDGLSDGVDVDSTGGRDSDDDGIEDSADASVTAQPDFDNDGIGDADDIDPDGDGISGNANALLIGALPDVNENGIPDFQESSVPEAGANNGDAAGDDGPGTGAEGGSDTQGEIGTGGGEGTDPGNAAGGSGGAADGSDATDGAPTIDDGEIVDDASGGSPRDDDSPRIETGLSGGAGCSIAGHRAAAGIDPVFTLAGLIALFGLFGRGRRRGRRLGCACVDDKRADQQAG